MNLTDVVIPEGVTSVGKLAFACCHELTNVVLPASLVSIKRQAFADCRSLSSITIPEGVTLTRDEVMDELAADFAGDMLDDADLFAKFSKENRTAAQKLLDSLKEFLAKVKTAFTGKYRDMAAQEAYGKDFAELEDIAKQWQAAFDAAERKAESTKKNATEGGEARYSLKQTSNGQTYVMVENAMTNAQLKDHQAIADYIAEHIGEVYTIIESGQRVYIGKDLPNEYTHSKYTQRIANSAKQRAKNRAVSNLGEMVEIATNRRWEKTRHPNNKDAAYGMYRYDTTFAFPVKEKNGVYRAYDAELLIRNASDGRKYLYDIVSIKENTGLALDLNQKARGRQNAATQSGASGTSILTDGENVKPQFSLKAPVEAEKKGHVKSAKEFFGETNNWNETGYITTGGTKLDFSGRHEGAPGGQTGRRGDGRDRRGAV